MHHNTVISTSNVNLEQRYPAQLVIKVSWRIVWLDLSTNNFLQHCQISCSDFISVNSPSVCLMLSLSACLHWSSCQHQSRYQLECLLLFWQHFLMSNKVILLQLFLYTIAILGFSIWPVIYLNIPEIKNYKHDLIPNIDLN